VKKKNTGRLEREQVLKIKGEGSETFENGNSGRRLCKGNKKME